MNKDDFLRVVRNIVGDEMVKQAANKVFLQLQMQAQTERNEQTNPSQHSLFSQVSAQQMPSSGSAQLHEQKVRPPGPPNQGQKNQVSPSPQDFAPLSGTQAQNSPEFQNSPGPEADPPLATLQGKSPASASQKKRKLPSVVPFDPTAYEGSLADYNFTQLSMIGATLGYKSALLGEVCVKKAKDEEIELLARRNEVSRLEDLIKSLQRQNNTLQGLVTTTKDQNEKLLTQNKKLRLSRDEAESRARSLEEKHNDSLEVLEKLWDTIAKDCAEKASLKKQVDQLETKLRDQEVLMKDSEEAMVSYFHEIFTKYTGVLAELGAEAFPYPKADDAESLFTWLEDELDGLVEVVSGVSDNCAMVSIEALLKFLDREGCDIMTRMSEQGFHFPSDLSSQETSKAVLTIKQRFARDFWKAYGREVAKSAALARLDEAKASAA